MARSKNTFVILSEYYPLRAFLWLLRVVPLSVGKFLSRGLVQGLLSILRKRLRLIDSQIALCFPDLNPVQREALSSRSLNYLAYGVAAFVRIPSRVRRGMDSWVTLDGAEHIEKAYREGKGMITFTAHYGFWEEMAVYVTQKYPRVSMVVRPLDNPRLDALVASVRASGGGGVIDSSRVFKEGLRLLRHNGILGILIDQNFYKGGVFVDFFGRPAATNTLVPILAHRTGCAVLPMHNVWEGDKIRILCEAPVTLSQNPDIAQAVHEDTQKLTSIVEGWIRKDPAQWLWLHNRWKRRPEPGETFTA